MNLSDKVLEVVQQFVQSNTLFTALDVSNEVKNSLPHARHREVRDIVRSLVTTVIEPAGYANTQINVKLPDGTSATAVLYHALSDSWDLDAKYDSQKREQTSVKPAQVQPVVVPVQAQAVVASVVAAQTQPVVSSTPVVKAAPPVQTPARVLWDNLFKSQPSLFPRK